MNEETDYEAKEKYKVSRNGHNRCVISADVFMCRLWKQDVALDIHSLLASIVTQMFRRTQEGPEFQWFA